MAHRTVLELSLVSLSQKAFNHLCPTLSDQSPGLFPLVLRSFFAQFSTSSLGASLKEILFRFFNLPCLYHSGRAAQFLRVCCTPSSASMHSTHPTELAALIPAFIEGRLSSSNSPSEPSYEERVDAQFHLLAAGLPLHSVCDSTRTVL